MGPRDRPPPARRAALVGVCLFAMAIRARPAPAIWRNLADPVELVGNFAISSDSRFVVYPVKETPTAPVELWSVPLAGGTPTKLNPPLVAGGHVFDFRITADSARVIYTAVQDTANRQELYVVPIAGGPATKLSGPLVAGGDVRSFIEDRASGRVVYAADQDTNETVELYSVPLAGGAGVKLNPTLVAGGNVLQDGMQIAPGTGRVVYRAEQEVSNRVDLFSVPVGGGTSTKLNADNTQVSRFEIDPGLPVVAFDAANVGSNQRGLFTNAVVGGLFSVISFPLAVNQCVVGFHISPDGAHVVYNVSVGDPAGFPGDGTLYSVLIGGGSSTPISNSADPGFGTLEDLFQFTPDGSRVVYLFTRSLGADPTIDSSGLDGSHASIVFLTEPAAFTLSADSHWVVVDLGVDDGGDIRSLPPTGGQPASLGVGYFSVITPDSTRVLFRRSRTVSSADLMSEQIFGGDIRNLSRARDDESLESFEVTPDGRSVVFTFRLADGRIQLRASDGTEGQDQPAPTSTTTTTTLPPRHEICNNCIDDDGDGLVDLDDPACCATSAALTLERGTLSRGKRGGARFALTATLPDATALPTSGADVQVQLGVRGGAPLLCADIPAAAFARTKARLRFHDARHAVASAHGLDRLTLARRKLVLGGKDAPFAVPAAGSLGIAIKTAGRCATAQGTFTARRKGLRLR